MKANSLDDPSFSFPFFFSRWCRLVCCHVLVSPLFLVLNASSSSRERWHPLPGTNQVNNFRAGIHINIWLPSCSAFSSSVRRHPPSLPFCRTWYGEAPHSHQPRARERFLFTIFSWPCVHGGQNQLFFPSLHVVITAWYLPAALEMGKGGTSSWALTVCVYQMIDGV